MRTRTKVWLMIAASLVLIGCFLFAGAMSSVKWDFTKLATVKYETNTYEISEVFDSVSMNTDTADIVFAFSDDGKCTVECHEEENAKHSVTVEDGTLTDELIDERSVYDFIGYIGLNFDSPKITIYLPKVEYTSLLIYEDTGDVEIPKDFTFKDVDISLSTGDIRFDNSDAAEIFAETDTGDVTGTLLTEKVFIAQTDTGGIDVLKTVTGGRCEIITITGSIKIAVV